MLSILITIKKIGKKITKNFYQCYVNGHGSIFYYCCFPYLCLHIIPLQAPFIGRVEELPTPHSDVFQPSISHIDSSFSLMLRRLQTESHSFILNYCFSLLFTCVNFDSLSSDESSGEQESSYFFIFFPVFCILLN